MATATAIPDGYLLVDKPEGPSSHSAVQAVRRALGIGGRRGTRAGHAGTLDPFATGLLLVLVGRATRLMPHVVGHDKRYLLDVAFGASSDTDDRTGTLVPSDAPGPTRSAVERALVDLLRSTEQVPPAVSAIHIDGERAYRRVRRGEEVVVPPRPVRFDSLELVDWQDAPTSTPDGSEAADGEGPAVATGPVARIDVRCSTGTYMRSLARDLGGALGCPAHAHALRRLEVGGWSVEGSPAPADARSRDLRPAVELVPDLPRHDLTAHELHAVAHGRRIPGDGFAAHIEEVALVSPSGTLAAIAMPTAAGLLQPRTVFVEAAAGTGDTSDDRATSAATPPGGTQA